MELKTKYQYTYFIYPYVIETKHYEKYILKLLTEKKCKMRIFEKEKDLDIYTYFNEKTREYMFPTFEYTKQNTKNLETLNVSKKSKQIAKEPCVIFEYNIGHDAQGKVGEKDGIFFKIAKIEIICFKTGICFLNIKTFIEETEKFEDILNFNYKFKDIATGFTKLKEYENIKIQTDIFTDMKELSEIVSEITGQYQNKRFFTYTYTCVDSEHWDNEKNETTNEFLKYVYVFPNSYNSNFSKENKIETVEQWEYVKWGITKQSSALLTTNIETRNYTKLLFAYENEYLYTVIINLYKKIYLEQMIEILKKQNKTELLDECLEEIWTKEITKDETGIIIDEKWRKILGIDNLYEEAKQKYELSYKQLNIEKNRKINKILIGVLGISLVLNILNLVILIKLIN